MNGYGMNGNMYDRGGMNMIGKVILVLALLAVGGIGLAVWNWSDHKLKDAQAELQLVTAEVARAELAAEQQYMDDIAAVDAQQRIAQMISDSQTRAVQDEAHRQSILNNLEHQRQLMAEEIAWKQSLHRALAAILLVAGVTFVIVIGGLIGYVLFKNVEERMEARAEVRAEVRVIEQRREPPQAPESPAAPQREPVIPRPTTPQSQPAMSRQMGRLPDLPQGQPKRGPAQTQPQAAPTSQPALAQSFPRRYVHADYGRTDVNYPNSNGNGTHTNGRGPHYHN